MCFTGNIHLPNPLVQHPPLTGTAFNVDKYLESTTRLGVETDFRGCLNGGVCLAETWESLRITYIYLLVQIHVVLHDDEALLEDKTT